MDITFICGVSCNKYIICKAATSFFNASGPVIGVNCELESAACLAIAAVVVNAARWGAGGGFIVRGVGYGLKVVVLFRGVR